MKKRILLLSSIFVLNSVLLFGCGKSAPAEAPAIEEPDETQAEQSPAESKPEPAAETAPAADAEGSKNQDFIDIVSGADPKEWDGFALIDLDGDGVDELFATCLEGEREDPGIQPYMIAGHDNSGKVVKNDELRDGVAGAGGYRGTLYYLEGMGLLHESMTYAPFGIPADAVYALRNGTIETTDTGEFSLDDYGEGEDDNWDPLEHGTWAWNGETVTEETYYGKLKEATNDTEGIPLYEIDWKNKDTILEILSGGGSSTADTAAQADEDPGAGETDMTDLFEYYGSNIEHAATDLPELKFDDSYKSAEGTTEISAPTDTMEKMSDGTALAGPFFTVDKEGTIVGESYGGKKYAVCGITVGMPISEAAEIAKSHGFNFSNAETAHGTAKYVAIYDNGEAQLCITSDADGVFGKTEESDVTGNVDNILITKK